MVGQISLASQMHEKRETGASLSTSALPSTMVFHIPLPDHIRKKIISDQIPTGSLTDSNLEMAALLLLFLVFKIVVKNLAELHGVFYSDNSPSIHRVQHLAAKHSWWPYNSSMPLQSDSKWCGLHPLPHSICWKAHFNDRHSFVFCWGKSKMACFIIPAFLFLPRSRGTTSTSPLWQVAGIFPSCRWRNLTWTSDGVCKNPEDSLGPLDKVSCTSESGPSLAGVH